MLPFVISGVARSRASLHFEIRNPQSEMVAGLPSAISPPVNRREQSQQLSREPLTNSSRYD
jgi:hypothetical protein